MFADDPPTNDAQSNALLALIQGDEEEARKVLADMLPGELAGLAEAARRLHELAMFELGLPASKRKPRGGVRGRRLREKIRGPEPLLSALGREVLAEIAAGRVWLQISGGRAIYLRPRHDPTGQPRRQRQVTATVAALIAAGLAQPPASPKDGALPTLTAAGLALEGAGGQAPWEGQLMVVIGPSHDQAFVALTLANDLPLPLLAKTQRPDSRVELLAGRLARVGSVERIELAETRLVAAGTIDLDALSTASPALTAVLAAGGQLGLEVKGGEPNGTVYGHDDRWLDGIHGYGIIDGSASPDAYLSLAQLNTPDDV